MTARNAIRYGFWDVVELPLHYYRKPKLTLYNMHTWSLKGMKREK